MYSRRSPSAAILEQFPGPVTLRPSIASLLYGRVFLGLVAIASLLAGVRCIAIGGESDRGIAVGFIFFAVSGMTIWTFIRSVSATDSITLAFDHFEVVRGRRHDSYLWSEVDYFRVQPSEESANVVFDHVGPDTKAHGWLSRFLGTDCVKLPCYELSEEELADLMNDWRRKARPEPSRTDQTPTSMTGPTGGQREGRVVDFRDLTRRPGHRGPASGGSANP